MVEKRLAMRLTAVKLRGWLVAQPMSQSGDLCSVQIKYTCRPWSPASDLRASAILLLMPLLLRILLLLLSFCMPFSLQVQMFMHEETLRILAQWACRALTRS